jgi:DNA-binding response OmpR family regulator
MHTSVGIVDGQPEGVVAFSTAFLAAGYDVEGVSSFDGAMRLISSRRRSALVVTIELGAFNGLHVLLKCLCMHPTTKVVVVGPDSATLRDEALALGASDYAARPIAPETIVNRVNAFLSMS